MWVCSTSQGTPAVWLSGTDVSGETIVCTYVTPFELVELGWHAVRAIYGSFAALAELS